MKDHLKIGFYIAPVFCAFLSLLMLFSPVAIYPVFYTSLPLCFFFIASPVVALYKRVVVLEKQIKEKNKNNL